MAAAFAQASTKLRNFRLRCNHSPELEPHVEFETHQFKSYRALRAC
jgi:hypothetical protein